MSLINDALKRAKETRPGNAPAASPPMQPTNDRPPSPGLPVYFVPVLLAIISGAGLFLWKGWETQHRQNASSSLLVVNAREVESAPESTETAEPGIPAGRNFSLNDDAPRATLLTGAATPHSSARIEAEPPRSAAPGFKLQGIFYRPGNASAVINTKTVFVGDQVANGRVKSISRDTVIIDCEGETKVLTLQ